MASQAGHPLLACLGIDLEPGIWSELEEMYGWFVVTLVSLSGTSGVTEFSNSMMVASGLLGVSVTGTTSRSPDSCDA